MVETKSSQEMNPKGFGDPLTVPPASPLNGTSQQPLNRLR